MVGARPNFIKIAPLIERLKVTNKIKKNKDINYILVHTGQHYQYEMSKVFFEDLELPKPDIYLRIGSGSHALQTARIMSAFEKVCVQEKPDLVVVVGDVNSTIACTLVAVKLKIKTAHIEAGLRSYDRSMPEEINRILTDSISDYLFTTCEDANENLKKEGVDEKRIFFVGNVMIDTLIKSKEKAKNSCILESLNLINHWHGFLNSDYVVRDYAVLTLHRPSNVDNKETFQRIIEALREISKHIPIVFPVHPRTLKMINTYSFQDYFFFCQMSQRKKVNITNSINIIDPFGYLDFLKFMSHSKFILTDSGGIQEESTILGIPCLTLRENTERPITITEGTNTLVGCDPTKILEESINIINGNGKKGRMPNLWDGRAAERIVKILVENYTNQQT